MLSRPNNSSTGNNASTGDRAPPADAAPGKTSSRVGWTVFGFIMGVGVWHAVGFWSFVTAVTLTGKPPERASMTAAVLAPDTPEQSEQIDPPKYVPVTRTQERGASPGTSPALEELQQAPRSLPLQTAEQPSGATPLLTGGTIVFAQPGLNTPTRSAETPAPAIVPTASAERTALPPTTAAPSGGSDWSTRIITGTID